MNSFKWIQHSLIQNIKQRNNSVITNLKDLSKLQVPFEYHNFNGLKSKEAALYAENIQGLSIMLFSKSEMSTLKDFFSLFFN